MFGTRPGAREKVAKGTVVNGIVNQCSLEEKPTPYWAVLDAACQLKTGFARKDVIALAVKRVGEDARRACEIAWDVLRNHHRHMRKREAGMSFMVDDGPDGKLCVRARHPDETIQYFEGEGKRKKIAVEAKKQAVVSVGEAPSESASSVVPAEHTDG